MKSGEPHIAMRCMALIPLLALTLLGASGAPAPAAPRSAPQLAATPPMGWNSWDSYGTSIREAQVRATALFMARRLKRYGWRYVVIDEGWYEAAPAPGARTPRVFMDAFGRYVPNPGRYPSAAGGVGMKALADYIHSLGLQFGIHILRGIPRQAVTEDLPIQGSSFHAADAADTTSPCPWNGLNYGVKPGSAAGQAYYDSIARLYASWGVDFVKADCISSHPYRGGEIRMLDAALRASGRPMVLSLSPGPAPLADAAELEANSQMWRIADDLWDMWEGRGDAYPQGVENQFARAAAWEPYAGPGHWPDADMMPLGEIGPHPGMGPPRASRLTPAEQQTLVTAWCVFRSPLIMGGNLPLSGPQTMALLTNPEVLAVDQHSTGNHLEAAGERHDQSGRTLPPVEARPQATVGSDPTKSGEPPVRLDDPDIVVWVAQAATPKLVGDTYVAVFNLGDQTRRIHDSWATLGLPARAYRARDLWQRKNLGQQNEVDVTLAPHAAALLRLDPVRR